jgi:sugar phosphate permease
VILAAGTAAQVTFSALQWGLPVLGPALRRDFGLSLAELGTVIGAPNLGVVLSVYGWGLVADRLGERRVLTAGLLGCGGAAALAAASSSYPALAAALLLAGAMGGCAASASGRAVIGWFGPEERGLALGVRQTAVPVGGAAAGLVLPAVEAAAGVAAALALLAVGLAGGALVSAAFLREPPALGRGRSAPHAGPAPLRDRRLWRLAAGCSLLVGAQYALTAFFPVWATEALGWSAAGVGTVLSVALGLSAVGRIGVGHWSDRLGRRVAPLRALALAGGLAAAAAAALASGAGALAALVLLGAVAVLWSWNGLAFAVAGELSGPARAGAALGLLITVLFTVGAAAPTVVGVAVDHGSWPAGFALVALAAAGGWWILGPLGRAQGGGP